MKIIIDTEKDSAKSIRSAVRILNFLLKSRNAGLDYENESENLESGSDASAESAATAFTSLFGGEITEESASAISEKKHIKKYGEKEEPEFETY